MTYINKMEDDGIVGCLGYIVYVILILAAIKFLFG